MTEQRMKGLCVKNPNEQKHAHTPKCHASSCNVYNHIH